MSKWGNKNTSYGIILVKRNKNEYSVVCVEKRHTYQFTNFTNGNISPNITEREIVEQFDTMTVSEKLKIHDFRNDFQTLYKSAWRDISNGKYNYARNNFQKIAKTFCLYNLCRKSNKNGRPIWEIPKGHKRFTEDDLTCAVREFTEETNIQRSSYKIIPSKKITYKFTDDGEEYTYVYYVAFTKRQNINLKINIKNEHQINEINDIRWINKLQAKQLDPKLHKLVNTSINIVRNYLKQSKKY